ncbi:octopamine receptor beta-2R-like [Paramacrobiotus metropolitanus]|uniref:octopamine receptor beta-2R-like n=1 Tax=Paramacrobiotus metropolitanus TaxID=2943436 RepID=UPI002445F72D|nr:octopamine receptor beta-2R-like [Paramacrobiotus metropolitanus]
MNITNATINITTTPLFITYRIGFAVWFWVMLSLCIVGTILNLLMIYIILSSAKLRVGSGILIVHLLAVLTSLCAVHMLLLSVSTYFYAPYQTLSSNFCVYSTWLYYACLDSVNWSSLLIGINRFVAIFFPTKYPLMIRNNVIATMIILSWMICFACCSQILAGHGGWYGSTKPWGTCGMVNPNSDFAIITAFAVTIPLTILGILYLAIFIGVAVKNYFDRKKILDGEHTKTKDGKGQAHKLFERRYHSAKVLFVSYLWYIACLLPAPIALSVYPASYSRIPLLSPIMRAVLLCGYATIPLIFLMMNMEYRRRLSNMARLLGRQLGIRPEVTHERTAEFATVAPGVHSTMRAHSED